MPILSHAFTDKHLSQNAHESLMLHTPLLVSHHPGSKPETMHFRGKSFQLVATIQAVRMDRVTASCCWTLQTAPAGAASAPQKAPGQVQTLEQAPGGYSPEQA